MKSKKRANTNAPRARVLTEFRAVGGLQYNPILPPNPHGMCALFRKMDILTANAARLWACSVPPGVTPSAAR